MDIWLPHQQNTVGEVEGLSIGGAGLQHKGSTGNRDLTICLFTVEVGLQTQLWTFPAVQMLAARQKGMNRNIEESLLTLWHGVRKTTSITLVKQNRWWQTSAGHPHPTHRQTTQGSDSDSGIILHLNKTGLVSQHLSKTGQKGRGGRTETGRDLVSAGRSVVTPSSCHIEKCSLLVYYIV